MEHLPEEISHARLMEAVDAIFDAEAELAAEGRALTYPPEMLGASDQPAAFCPFTRFEIEEATRFLARMGMLRTDREAI